MNKKDKEKLSRREFFREATKGALAIGCFSIGLNEACKSEKPGAGVEKVAEVEEKIKTIDMARVSTCSIALNHLSADKAFEIIAAAGRKKVDVHEKVHFLLFEDLCDPVELKATAEKHGLLIANLATYPGGGLYGWEFMYSFHHWEVPHPERFTSCGFSSNLFVRDHASNASMISLRHHWTDSLLNKHLDRKIGDELKALREQMPPFLFSETVNQKLERIWDLAHYRYQPPNTQEKSSDQLEELSPVEKETLEGLSQAFGTKIYVRTRKGGELIALRHG